MVTAATDSYFPYLEGLISNVMRRGIQRACDIAVLDIDFSGPHLQWLHDQSVRTERAIWDFEDSVSSQGLPLHCRALTVRPHLRRYFPGYSVYLWVDPDVLIQNGNAFNWYLQGAREHGLAIAAEADGAYRQDHAIATWRVNRLASYFGMQAATELLSQRHYYNAGIWAMRADAPHWEAWARHLGAGLRTTRGSVVCDQTALNYAIFHERLPMLSLPATANWLCHLAPPKLDPDGQTWSEATLPRRSLPLLHFSGDTKNLLLKFIARQTARMGDAASGAGRS
jgi:hypothetical protein